MRSLNKIGAVATGALMAMSSVLAAPMYDAMPADFTKDWLVDASGAPIAKVVVGSNAPKGIDTIGAANIAALVGSMTFNAVETETPAVTTGDKTVKLEQAASTGSTVTVTKGDRVTFHGLNPYFTAASSSDYVAHTAKPFDTGSSPVYYRYTTPGFEGLLQETTWQDASSVTWKAFDRIDLTSAIATNRHGDPSSVKNEARINVAANAIVYKYMVEKAGVAAPISNMSATTGLIGKTIPAFGKNYGVLYTATGTSAKAVLVEGAKEEWIKGYNTPGKEGVFTVGDYTVTVSMASGTTAVFKIVGPGMAEGGSSFTLDTAGTTVIYPGATDASSNSVTKSLKMGLRLKSVTASSAGESLYLLNILHGSAPVVLEQGKEYDKDLSQVAGSQYTATVLQTAGEFFKLTDTKTRTSKDGLKAGEEISLPRGVASLKYSALSRGADNTLKIEKTTITISGTSTDVLKVSDMTTGVLALKPMLAGAEQTAVDTLYLALNGTTLNVYYRDATTGDWVGTGSIAQAYNATDLESGAEFARLANEPFESTTNKETIDDARLLFFMSSVDADHAFDTSAADSAVATASADRYYIEVRPVAEYVLNAGAATDMDMAQYIPVAYASNAVTAINNVYYGNVDTTADSTSAGGAFANITAALAGNFDVMYVVNGNPEIKTGYLTHYGIKLNSMDVLTTASSFVSLDIPLGIVKPIMALTSDVSTTTGASGGAVYTLKEGESASGLKVTEISGGKCPASKSTTMKKGEFLKLAYLDSEIEAEFGTAHMILVGGPAVNTLTAKLMKLSDYKEGDKYIKYFADKNAWVIAGFRGDDTLVAVDHFISDYLKAL